MKILIGKPLTGSLLLVAALATALAVATPFGADLSSSIDDPFGRIDGMGTVSMLDPPEPLPVCDTNECSGQPPSMVYYYPQSNAWCAALEQGIDFYQWGYTKKQWTCPGGVYYYSCYGDGPTNEFLCSAFTAKPDCPAGTCDPYNGGHPG